MEENNFNLETLINNLKAAGNFPDIQSTIMVESPVKKIDYTDFSQPASILAVYLLSIKNSKTKLKEVALMDDMHDQVILYFQPQHIVELGAYFYGIFSFLEFIENNTKVFAFNGNPLDMTTNFMKEQLSHPITYLMYKNNIQSTYLAVNFKMANPSCHNIIRFIIKKAKLLSYMIPFVSYTNLDKLAKEAVDFYIEHNIDNKIDLMEFAKKELKQELQDIYVFNDITNDLII